MRYDQAIRFARRCAGWVSALALVCAQAVGAPPAPSTQPGEPVAIAAARAAEWVGRSIAEEAIDAFAPAADVRYRAYREPKPLRMWIVRIDLSAPGVRLTVTEPTDLPDEDGASRETLCANTLEFARQRGVQLAVNTSAFGPFRDRMGMPMDVVGLAAARGQVYSEPDKRFGAMYVSRRGRIALKRPPLDTDDVWHVIAGFRMLVDDGQAVVTQAEADTGFGGVNPRTAVGTDRAGRTLWIVVVDGRQNGVSEGMTLVELAALFRSLGAWDALNLDGGGSSTLVLENADHTYGVVNTPVGRGAPGTLRQVASNMGLHLPGEGRRVATSQPATLRDTIIRLASSRRGGGYKWAGDGVSKTISYDGQTVLRANAEGTFCCGATLEAFLDGYCIHRYGTDSSRAEGLWFEGWPLEKFLAIQKGWWGTEDAVTNPHLPDEVRSSIREKQLYHVLPWTGLAEPVESYRLLQRGDFVQFWRRKGSGHSAIFWGRDRDETERERLWYWSSQAKPRYAYPSTPGGPPVKTPGYSLNWEYVGDEIDPQRIYGVRVLDTARSDGS